MRMLIVLAMALVAAPTLAHTIAEDATPKKAKKAVDPNKRVCRSEAETGSRIPQTTCRTQAQWDAQDQANAAAAEDLMRRRPPAKQ